MINLSQEDIIASYKLAYWIYKEGDATAEESYYLQQLQPTTEGIYINWAVVQIILQQWLNQRVLHSIITILECQKQMSMLP